MTLSWYEVSPAPHGAGQRLTFQRHATARFWPESVLRDAPLPLLPGPCVELEGPGAMWMYAAGALHARASGASEIRVFQPGQPGVTVWPPEGDAAPWCACRMEEPGYVAAMMQPAAGEQRWAPGGFAGLGASLAALAPVSVTLTGPGANWMYAGAALAAQAAGAVWIDYDSPAGEPVVVGGPPEALGQALPGLAQPEGPGRVIGLLGDPNSGKSVFSRLLFEALRRVEPQAWLMDCDAASPTPPWYLIQQSTPQQPLVEALRKAQKIDWSDALEDQVAERLRRLRRRLAVTLADLPGGNHKAAPPLRVPPHREVILFEVDRFVILARDADTEPAWRAALAPHGLDGRIAAVLTSHSPQAHPRDAVTLRQRGDGPCWRGEVWGLQRGHTLGREAESQRALEALLGRLLE